jgi:hypothetical protein
MVDVLLMQTLTAMEVLEGGAPPLAGETKSRG